jgi:hypothetical protein
LALPLNNILLVGGGQCSKGGKPVGVGAYRLVEPVVGRRASGTAVSASSFWSQDIVCDSTCRSMSAWSIMVNGDCGIHSTGLIVVPLTASAAA